MLPFSKDIFDSGHFLCIPWPPTWCRMKRGMASSWHTLSPTWLFKGQLKRTGLCLSLTERPADEEDCHHTNVLPTPSNAASDCCCSHCCCYCNPPSFPNSPLGSVLFESISAARDSWQLLTGIRWGITDCGSALLLKSSCRDREWVLSVQDWEAADGSFSPITIQ